MGILFAGKRGASHAAVDEELRQGAGDASDDGDLASGLVQGGQGALRSGAAPHHGRALRGIRLVFHDDAVSAQRHARAGFGIIG